MKDKIITFIKRINDWFLKPSPLSLLVSLVAPVLSVWILFILYHDFPDHVIRFIQMQPGSHGVPYESWLIGLFFSIALIVWCVFNWFTDLVRYIISLFRKSSAPADDK